MSYVTHKQTISWSNGKGVSHVLPPGSPVPADLVADKHEFDRLMKLGLIVTAARAVPVEAPDPAALAAAAQLAKENAAKIAAPNPAVIPEAPSAPASDAPPAPTPATGAGPFNLNPADLAGKSLDELKIMVAERDPSLPLEAITSTADAIEILSTNFADAPRVVAS